jgi:hypothetical protein
MSENTRIEELSKPNRVEVPEFKDEQDQIEDANAVTDALITLANAFDGTIRAQTKFTDSKIKYLEEVHNASKKYWAIVGTTVGVLVAIKGFQIAWHICDWFKRQKEKKVQTQEGALQEADIAPITQRLHPRDWIIGR